jgi:hypothetical protein
VVRGYKNVDLIEIVDIVDCFDPYDAAEGQVNGPDEEAKD